MAIPGLRSRNSIANFILLKPRTFAEAIELISLHPETVPIAGGLDVINRMKEGVTPPRLLMLTKIGGLNRISVSSDNGTLDIGATASHDDVATSPLVRARLADLAACWGRIANIRIRMQGTVVGNLFAGSASYEGAILLAALGAAVSIESRYVAPSSLLVHNLVVDAGSAGQPRGLARAVQIPLPPPGTTRRLVYDRSLRPALSVALRVDHARGRVTAARAVLGGCHAWPILRDVPLAGYALSEAGSYADDMAAATFSRLPPATVPWFGHPLYREHAAPVLLSRLIKEIVP
jgi:carbon-monoxide dehydrogenase medium subunit